MDILQKDNGQKGMFYIELEGKIAAEMTYVYAGKDRIIVDHSAVNDSLRGKSAGKQMVSKVVDFARQKGLTIIPLCPFAKSVFDKVIEFKDVL